MNLGRMQDEYYQFDQAAKSFGEAMKLAKDDDQRATILLNLGCMLVNKGDWQQAAEVSARALRLKPDNKKIKANIGIAKLALGEWEDGWKNYDEIVSFDTSRGKIKYGDEDEWDGRPGQVVIAYGEQGLGDEVSFASMLPDLIDVSKRVVIDCDSRLEGLFKRSFPQAEVHGTRWAHQVTWDTACEASVTMGGLGKFFRTKDSQFKKQPYLVADPDRVSMWRALFAKSEKPTIGIAWTGGLFWTAERFRKMTLEDLLPLFRSVDANWVSLQYKDCSKELREFREKHGVEIKQYPWATLTKDYDDTAGLVAAVDYVVSMQTSVIHLAGGLGKEVFCFVNKHGQWRYGAWEWMPWYPKVKLFRQKEDNSYPVERVVKQLKERIDARRADTRA